MPCTGGSIRPIKQRRRTVEQQTAQDELYMRKLMANFKVKQLLEMLDFYDEETYRHSLRVAHITLDLYNKAEELGIIDGDKTDKRNVVLAALLHDIGKMFVPHEILHKKTYLTTEELMIVKEHPVLGADMARIYGFPEAICEMIENHHKKMDGSGYPNTKKYPSAGAMLVATADIFSAITEKRSYKDSQDAEVGIEIVREEIEAGHLPPYYGALLETIISEKQKAV